MKKLLAKKIVTKEKTKGTKKKAKKDLSVDDIVASMKGFDVEAMSDKSIDQVPYHIPFRHRGLQAITGGIPGGKFTEIQGDSQSGKSYLLYELIAECLGMGGFAMLHDVERAYEPKFGARVGIEGDKKFLMSWEKELEKVFLSSRKFIATVRASNKTCPILIGVDSFPPITTIISQKELDAQLAKGAKELKGYREAKKNALFSSIISEFTTYLSDHKATLVLLNQTRKQMGVVFGDPTTSNADNIIKFYVTLRLRGRLGAKVSHPKDKKKKIGVHSSWETIKNRGIFPFKKVQTRIIYRDGIAPYSGLSDLLIAEGVVTQTVGKDKKKYLKFKEQRFINAKELVKAHPEVLTLE